MHLFQFLTKKPKSRHSTPRNAPLGVEALEDRCVPSANPMQTALADPQPALVGNLAPAIQQMTDALNSTGAQTAFNAKGTTGSILFSNDSRRPSRQRRPSMPRARPILSFFSSELH